MCVVKKEMKTKVDFLIDALNANTAALKASVVATGSKLIVPETEHQEPQPQSLER